MFTGIETMAAYALLKRHSEEIKGNKHVEVCRNCGKPFVTDDTREFCSYDCQKTA